MSVSCLFPGCFSLSPGSNLPNPTSWRVVPWLCLWDAVLKHIQVLNLGIFRAQDINFPVQGTRGMASCPCPTSSHFPTLSTQDLGYAPAQWEFGLWPSSHFTPICALASEWEFGNQTRTCFAALSMCPQSRIHIKPWPTRFSQGLQGGGKAARRGVSTEPTS